MAWRGAYASIGRFLSEPGLDLHGTTINRYRYELQALVDLVDPQPRRVDETARALAASIAFGGITSPMREAPFSRVHDFLAWLREAGDEETAKLAADLTPAFDAAVRSRLALPIWDPWPNRERETSWSVEDVSGPVISTGGGGLGSTPAGASRIGVGMAPEDLKVAGGFERGGRRGAPSPGSAGRPKVATPGRVVPAARAQPTRAKPPGPPAMPPSRSARVASAPLPDSFDDSVASVGDAVAAAGPDAPMPAMDTVAADQPTAATAAAGPPPVVAADEETAEATTPATDAPHEAYGKIVAPDVAVVGEPFELEVGLSAEEPKGVTSGSPIELPSLKGPKYFIDVQIVADAFDIGPDESFRQRLEVSRKRPFPSVIVHLTPRPQATDKSLRSLQATFGLNGETVGMALRRIDVYVPGAAPQAPRPIASIRGIITGVPKGDPKADVTIEIFRPDTSGSWRWHVRSPRRGVEPDVDSAFEGPLQEQPEAFAARIRGIVEANDESATIGSILVGAGRLIGRAIPAEVWDALRAARQAVRKRPLDILLLSQEPYVPWELAIPSQPLVAGERPTFLGATANIGRWPLGEPPPASFPPRTAPARAIGVVQGSYRGPTFETLPGAGREVRALRQRYGAQRIEPKNVAVKGLLAGQPPLDVIHFAVHGAVDETGHDDDGLILAEGAAGGAPVKLSPLLVEGSTLAVGAPAPFVFLNACQVGAARQTLATYGGLAAAFLHWGAVGVVAPIWAIDDDVSHEIALGIYERALVEADPPPIASLLREARQRFDPAAETTSATFLAYQLYGHPSMRLVRAAPDHT